MADKKWLTYWNKQPKRFNEIQFFEQVGATLSGKPISDEQFHSTLNDIKTALDITRDDIVLDLCCGNGMITKVISENCASIVGVDFSEYLIHIAKKYHFGKNIKYYSLSLFDKQLVDLFPHMFNKIIMYGSLQYFEINDFGKILKQISHISTPDTVIFIGSVPDRDRIWDFYNTEEKKDFYYQRLKSNQEWLGSWWKKDQITEISIANNFQVEFLKQGELTDTSYYRFDMKLKPTCFPETTKRH